MDKKEIGNMNVIYDYCIIGGGISGLYMAYRLLKKDNSCSVILLEKEGYLGGRILTGNIMGNKGSIVPVSAGAGRFSKDHVLFMKLLREFRLLSSIHEIKGASIHYHIMKGHDGQHNVVTMSPEYMYELIETVKKGSRALSKSELLSISFVELAGRYISTESVKYILDSFGYYSELVIMNAYDSLKLLGELNTDLNRFYYLSGSGGGFSQVIDRLVSKIVGIGGCEIKVRSNVSDVVVGSSGEYQVSYHVGSQMKNVFCKSCIFTVPVPSLLGFHILSPLRPVLKNIVCAPLCRIYATYDVGSVWFAGMSRFTVNNQLRMVIPISESDGVIMISYTDHHFANYWNRIYDLGGKRGLKKEIRRLISSAMGYQVPDCKTVEMYYWRCGVGYWGVGADSLKISRKLVQPFSNEKLYLCGENIASGHQQWVEGSLETCEKVLSKLGF